MSQFNRIDIRKLDGKLLLVFRELLRRRSASEVADTLGLTQSAISHSLVRLRSIFDDKLFVRRPHGLEPTPRAVELGPRVEALIDLASSVLSPVSAFQPERSERHFTIAAPQYVLATIGGDLLKVLHAAGPGLSIEFTHLRLREAVDALRSGRVDIAIGRYDNELPQLSRMPLYSDRFCVAAASDHPRIRGSVDLETYASAGSIFAIGAPEGSGHPPLPGPSVVSTRAIVPQWFTALLLVAQTDAIATLPRRLAERFSAALRLQVLEHPTSVTQVAGHFDVVALKRDDVMDPAVDWLIELLHEVAAQEGASLRGHPAQEGASLRGHPPDSSENSTRI